MKVGLVVPQFGKHATKENLLKFVKLAENEKFESLWVFDRMLCPIEPLQPYPNTPDQKTWPEYFQNVMDPLTTLSFIAANTTTPLLGTCIIDMVFHNPVSLAKQFTTIDILSDGRILCGLGIGWSEDEYKTANIPFEKRGARANEILQVMKKTWTDEIVDFNGKFYQIPKSTIGPKPIQKPHPKILLGGFAPQTFQRMNNYGNGYIGVMAGPFEFFQSMAQSYHQTIEKSTRSANEFEFSVIENGGYSNKINSNQIQELELLIEEIQESNLKIVFLNQIDKNVLEYSENKLESIPEYTQTQIDPPSLQLEAEPSDTEAQKIPDWIRNTMQWYLDEVISEDEMISAIQFLVKEGIIILD